MRILKLTRLCKEEGNSEYHNIFYMYGNNVTKLDLFADAPFRQNENSVNVSYWSFLNCMAFRYCVSDINGNNVKRSSVSPRPKKGHGKVAKKGHFSTRSNVSKGHF